MRAHLLEPFYNLQQQTKTIVTKTHSINIHVESAQHFQFTGIFQLFHLASSLQSDNTYMQHACSSATPLTHVGHSYGAPQHHQQLFKLSHMMYALRTRKSVSATFWATKLTPKPQETVPFVRTSKYCQHVQHMPEQLVQYHQLFNFFASALK